MLARGQDHGMKTHLRAADVTGERRTAERSKEGAAGQAQLFRGLGLSNEISRSGKTRIVGRILTTVKGESGGI